jgi:transposase
VKIDLEEARIFVRSGTTDMRNHINSLAIIAKITMKPNPFAGNLFLISDRQ